MSDGDALLRAILDFPDDDAPRLVYADWLEEHGDPARATFIRAQIQLTRLPDNDPDRDRLVQTERTLWRANRDAWSAWVPRWAKFQRFRRGFLEVIHCDAAEFMAHADAVRSQTPLTGIQVEGSGDLAVPLFRSRCLDGIRGLTIELSSVPRGSWEHLAACPYLHRLTEFDVGSNAFPEELVGAIVSSVAFPSLSTLRLKYMALGDDQATLLVTHPWAQRLRALDLGNNFLTKQAAGPIEISQFLEQVEYLNLRGNPLAEHRPTVTALRQRFGARVWV